MITTFKGTRLYQGPHAGISHQPMEDKYIDPELKRIYEQLNCNVFEGRLPDISNLSFLVFADYNGRSKTRITAGSFYYWKDGRCGIVIEYAITQNQKEFIEVFKHELIHYMLYKEGKHFSDGDVEFSYWCGWYHATLTHGMSKEIKEFNYREDIF